MSVSFAAGAWGGLEWLVSRCAAVILPETRRSELATLFPPFDDTRYGWKHLTSYDVIEEILSQASSDKTMKQASKLSLWLTFQMYREVSGVEI